MDKTFPYKIVRCSVDRVSHEDKKAWLSIQGIEFGDYELEKANELITKEHAEYWRGLNFTWCFQTPEIVTAFILRYPDVMS